MKKVFFISFVLIFCFLFVSCDQVGDSFYKSNNDLSVEGVPSGRFFLVDRSTAPGMPSTYTICDRETGVLYLAFCGMYGLSLCPLYNADGTLCVYEVEQ